jgi:uncharacterized protein YjcR
VSARLRAEVRKRYLPGVFGYKRLAREFGVPVSTVRWWVNDEAYERNLAKHRR